MCVLYWQIHIFDNLILAVQEIRMCKNTTWLKFYFNELKFYGDCTQWWLCVSVSKMICLEILQQPSGPHQISRTKASVIIVIVIMMLPKITISVDCLYVVLTLWLWLCHSDSHSMRQPFWFIWFWSGRLKDWPS